MTFIFDNVGPQKADRGAKSVFVACPLGPQKRYSVERWIEAVKNLDWEWPVAWAMEECEPDEQGRLDARGRESRYWQAWKILIECAAGYAYTLSCDSDVIVPPQTLKVLFSHFDENTFSVGHAYTKKGSDDLGFSAGLMLFPTHLLARAIEDYVLDDCPRSAFECQLGAPGGSWGVQQGMRIVCLWKSELEIEHV